MHHHRDKVTENISLDVAHPVDPCNVRYKGAVLYTVLRMWLWMLALTWGLASCHIDQSVPKIPVIIDADTANEVDDLYALVRAIAEPTLDIKAITSAQFHTSPLASEHTALESQKMNEDIIRLMDRADIELPLGSNHPLLAHDRSQPSEASDFIVKIARRYKPEDPLHLVILGSCTNVASAIIQDPEIIPNVFVHYLGFWHEPATNTYDKKEFNSGNDTLAVNLLLDTPGLKMDVMTATTSQHLVFRKEVVDQKLRGRGGIYDYLVDRWDTYQRWWTNDDPDKLNWIMWDIAIIEAIIHPHLTTKEFYLTPPENIERTIGIYTSIDTVQVEKNFWQSLENTKL